MRCNKARWLLDGIAFASSGSHLALVENNHCSAWVCHDLAPRPCPKHVAACRLLDDKVAAVRILSKSYACTKLGEDFIITTCCLPLLLIDDPIQMRPSSEAAARRGHDYDAYAR